MPSSVLIAIVSGRCGSQTILPDVGVDGCAVRGGDVDAEVEGLRLDVAVGGLADARVAEEASDGMLLVEGLERPAVGAGSGTCVRHGECCECRQQHEAAEAPPDGNCE